MPPTKKRYTTNAVEIMRDLFIKGDPEREESIQIEGVNAEIAAVIYDMRKEAGLSQKELADLVGTTQSVISRLEDSDYDGHSLPMLYRITNALGLKITITISGGTAHRKRSAAS